MSNQNIYDNQRFFDGYKKLRGNPSAANDIVEKPALFSLAPDLHNKSVLDIGCGYGENCVQFLKLGAAKVTVLIFPQKCWKLQEMKTHFPIFNILIKA